MAGEIHCSRLMGRNLVMNKTLTKVRNTISSLLLSIFLIGTAANAAIIIGIDTTQDTDSGLEWLHLDQTVNFSVDGALATFTDYRHATGQEVREYWTNSQIRPNTPVFAGLLNADELAFVSSHGGFTLDTILHRSLRGSFDDEDGDPNTSGLASLIDTNDLLTLTMYSIRIEPNMVVNTIVAPPTDPHGHYLVRPIPATPNPVPEPSTFLLTACGLMGMFAVRRNRRMKRTLTK